MSIELEMEAVVTIEAVVGVKRNLALLFGILPAIDEAVTQFFV